MSAPIGIAGGAAVTVPVKNGEKYFAIGAFAGSTAITISFAPEAPQACEIILDLVQDGTGDRAFTFAAGTTVHGAPATTGDAANSTRLLVLQYDELTEGWFYIGGSITTS